MVLTTVLASTSAPAMAAETAAMMPSVRAQRRRQVDDGGIDQCGVPGHAPYFLRPYFAVKVAGPSLLALIMKPTSAAVPSGGISSLRPLSA